MQPTPWNNVDGRVVDATGEKVLLSDFALTAGNHPLQCLADGNVSSIVHAINCFPRLVDALQLMVDGADKYSDEMSKIGRGSSEFGEHADSISLSGIARAVLRTARGETSADPGPQRQFNSLPPRMR